LWFSFVFYLGFNVYFLDAGPEVKVRLYAFPTTVKGQMLQGTGFDALHQAV